MVMKIQRLLIVLTLVNLALLIFTLAQMRPAAAQSATPVLRGRALEIVDDHGRVRASSRCFLQAHRRMASVPLKPCCSG
jgi:hypothetical protein